MIEKKSRKIEDRRKELGKEGEEKRGLKEDMSMERRSEEKRGE